MEPELRKVKVYRGMSEETEAFTAQLWVDGNYIADLKNDGHGGANRITHRFDERTDGDGLNTRPQVKAFEDWCREQLDPTEPVKANQGARPHHSRDSERTVSEYEEQDSEGDDNMITKEQALTAQEFHAGECTQTVGPRGGVKTRQEIWRRNGQTKTWKTRPEEFRVPLKHGMNNCGYAANFNASMFHTVEDCPLPMGIVVAS